jgi:hypothetical protein
MVATVGHRTAEKDGFVDLEVFYVNRHYKSICSLKPEWVRILAEHIKNWSEVDT